VGKKKNKSAWHRRHFFKRKKSSSSGVGHPAYIYAQSGQNYKYLAFTHRDKTDDIDNIPLKFNIDPDEPDENVKSYMVPKSKIDKQSNFQDSDKRYRIHKDDMETVRRHKK
jgi:hypothetical protein